MMRLLIEYLIISSALFVSGKDINSDDEFVMKVSTARGKIPIEELSKRKNQEQLVEPTEYGSGEKCGGIFNKKQFIIYSPGYPNAYPKNTVCMYILHNDYGRNCEFHFQFLDFLLENSEDCRKDHLKISDNEILCGNNIGVKSFRTKTNNLLVKFTSDDTVEDRGFKILVTQLPCTEEVKNETTYDKNESITSILTTRSVSAKTEDAVNKNVSFVFPVATDIEITPGVAIYTTSKPDTTAEGRERQFNHVPPYPTYPNDPNWPIVPNHNYPSYPFPPPGLPSPPIQPISPVDPNLIYPSLPACCSNTFAERNFLLASPGFPNSNIHRVDCQYRIYRSGPRSCRLRLKFRYFWNGVYDHQLGCSRGFLEIDGQKICGCRSGLEYEMQWGNGPAVIRYRNEGVPDLFYSGFVLEVTQLECPYRYLKDDIKVNNAFKINRTEKLYEFDDISNRVTWPKKRSVELLAQNVSFDFEDSDFGLPSFDPKPIKTNNNNHNHNHIVNNNKLNDSNINITNTNTTQTDIPITTNTTKVKRSANSNVEYYFFDSPWIDDSTEEFYKHETEGVTSKFLLPNGFDNGVCRLWGLKQWLALSAETLWQQRPICLPAQNNRVCKILQPNHQTLRGDFQSPKFPNFYPNNLDVCYRFIYISNHNKIRLFFVEFALEDSPNCSRDKLIIGNRAYCAHDLQQQTITLAASGNRFADIRFITDSYNSQRGFLVQYKYDN